MTSRDACAAAPALGQRQQRTRVAHRQRARREVRAHFVGQLQQPQEVGDRAAVLADGRGDLVLRQPELVRQPLIGQRLVDRVQVLALDVLDERQLEQLTALSRRRRRARRPAPSAGRRAAPRASAVRRR